jgi:hypothetical protein
MSPPATYDDANLILRLYELRRDEKLRHARDWFAKSFKVKTMEDFNKLCPPTYDTNAYFRMVVSYWEMVASFIASGVLNQELYFQSGTELLFCWERVRDILPEMREANKSPGMLKNLEIVAAAYIEYLNRLGPGTYTAFSGRVRS